MTVDCELISMHLPPSQSLYYADTENEFFFFFLFYSSTVSSWQLNVNGCIWIGRGGREGGGEEGRERA